MPKCECGLCKYCLKRSEYLRHRDAYIQRATAYQKQNRERTNEKNSRWKKRNPDKLKGQWKRRNDRVRGTELSSTINRKCDLKRNYKVTPEWWDAKFEEQGKACGICGCTENNANNRRMHVDHSHITDRNRGILCHRCNTALERLESDENWTTKALAYLKHYEDLYWESVNDKYSN